MRTTIRSGFNLILVAVAALTAGPSGCGGDEARPPETPPLLALFAGVTPQPAAGAVNGAEIGGTGLSVLSAHAPAAAVGEGGAFATRVSDIGAQVLFVVDASDELRAMALAIPGSNEPATAPATLVVDAESTALGILFLVPGVGSSEIEEAVARSAELREYASFKALVSHLKTALSAGGLIALNQPDGELETLSGACVTEWLGNHPQLGSSSSALSTIAPPDAELQVHNPSPINQRERRIAVDLVDQAANARGNVKIENRSWSYLDVQRRTFPDGKVSSLTSCPLGLLDGVRGASWGTLFYGGFGEATRSVTDPVDLAGNLWVEYWFRGPGFQLPQHSPSLPSDLAKLEPCAWVMSGVMYLALPVISIVGGLGKAASIADVDIAALKSYLWIWVSENVRGRNVMKALDSVGKKIDSQDAAGFRRSVVDLTVALIGAVAAHAEVAIATAGSAGAIGTAAIFIAKPLAIVSGLMSAANVTVAVQQWTLAPNHLVQYVARPLYGASIAAEPDTAMADGADSIDVSVTVGRYAWTQDPQLDFGADAPAQPTKEAGAELTLALRASAQPAEAASAIFDESDSPVMEFTTFTSGASQVGHLVCTEPGTYQVGLDGESDDLVLVAGQRTVSFEPVVWNAAADFSVTDNPNGAWTAGSSTGLGTALMPFTDGVQGPCGFAWGGFGTAGTPVFWKNMCTDLVNGVAPGQVSLHPNCTDNSYAVLRWTAPGDASYGFDVQFFAGDHGGTHREDYVGDTDAYVMKNGATNVQSFPNTDSNPRWSGVLALVVGDTIDFVVGTAGEDCGFDNTPLEVIIEPQ